MVLQCNTVPKIVFFLTHTDVPTQYLRNNAMYVLGKLGPNFAP